MCYFSLLFHHWHGDEVNPHVSLKNPVAICSLPYPLPRPRPWCHSLKGILSFLTVCFSHAIIQCISHVMLITVEGKKSHQVQKSKKAVTRQWHEWDKGVHKRGADLRQPRAGQCDTSPVAGSLHTQISTWRQGEAAWEEQELWMASSCLSDKVSLLYHSAQPVQNNPAGNTVFLEDLQRRCWLPRFSSDR